MQQNANALQQKLAERQKLLSQLDQARMQEQLNTAMASLSQAVDQDVPTFDDVRAKIEAQYAKALGVSELSGQNVEARMLEIEQQSVNVEAQLRLEQMRAQMGLPSGAQAAGQAQLAGAPVQAAGALNPGRPAPTPAEADDEVAEAEAPAAQPARPSDN